MFFWLNTQLYFFATITITLKLQNTTTHLRIYILQSAYCDTILALHRTNLQYAAYSLKLTLRCLHTPLTLIIFIYCVIFVISYTYYGITYLHITLLEDLRYSVITYRKEKTKNSQQKYFIGTS